MDILPQLLVNAVITGSIYALASAGLSLVYGLQRILNFAHGHFMMLGAYCFYYFTVERGLSAWASIFPALLFAILVASISLRIFILPFTRYSYLLCFVTTLALSIILESLVCMFFGVNVKSLSIGAGSTSYEVAGVYITPVQIVIILSALVLLLMLGFVVHVTALGRKIRALRENDVLAESLGINRTTIVYGVFFVATVLAMYAGILVGYETNLQPTMGSSYTIKAFAAMLLGGLGNVWGTIAGSYLLGLVENFSIGLDLGRFSVPAGYKDAFAFMIILLVLLIRPQGVFMWSRRVA